MCFAVISQSAVALGVGLGSLAHRGWLPCSERVSVRTLRQSYITPHCIKCMASQSQAPLCPRTASRPSGLRSRRYAKLPSLERSPVVGAPRSLRALRAAACRPSGVLALWHMSGASRIGLVGGFAVHLVLTPAHPWVLLASQLRPRGLPVRPPRGLPQPARLCILVLLQSR